ncbi:uncharacterized protein [Dermacentor andersoni]|uniref:uncharacterized protein n=1 Tax=Dermacentor andersoni TaxID=34620 RepID=UPI003B3A7585
MPRPKAGRARKAGAPKAGARSRPSSPLPGADTDTDQLRYLVSMVKELECVLESTFATTQAYAHRICRNVDMWFDNIIRTVPKEVLDRPYKEVWENIPCSVQQAEKPQTAEFCTGPT